MEKLDIKHKCVVCGEKGWNSDALIKRGGKYWHKRCFKVAKREMRRRLHV